MSRHLFSSAVLLLLLMGMMCCTACGAANAERSGTPSNKVTLFVAKTTISGWNDNDNIQDQVVDDFRSPSLMYVDGVVVAFVEAHHFYHYPFVGIAVKFMTDDEMVWKDSLAKLRVQGLVYRLLSPTAIVDGTNIPVLFGGYGKNGDPLSEGAITNGGYWQPRKTFGLIVTAGNKKEFKWGEDRDSRLIPPDFVEMLKKNPYTQFLGGGGAGIQMKDGTYVLPIQAVTKEGNKKVSSIIYLEKAASNWTFSEGRSDDGCILPAVLEWEKERDTLLMMTSCEDGSRRIYKSTDKGKTWTEAVDTLSGVWGNSLTRTGLGVQGGFITATIDKKDVILLTLPVYSGEDKETQKKGRLHLWMTDTSHIYHVGPISTEGEYVTSSTLLYVPKTMRKKDNKEKLYCSYEVIDAADGKPKHSIVFVDLTDKLDTMKNVLKTWEEKDTHVSGLYNCTAQEDSETQNDCKDVYPTKGLVGYLSKNSIKDNQWEDEYRCVNAAVKKGTGNDKGVMFQGADAGAQWPVSDQGQNQPYHFANNAFTLVATVTIQTVPAGNTPLPLMGASFKDGDTHKVLLGLSYTKNQKWEVTFNDKEKYVTKDKGWEPNRPHHVALRMNVTDGWSVYVDGEKISDSDTNVGNEVSTTLKDLLKSKSISHFYVGRNSDNGGEKGADDIHVTVNNVLLYNRVLTENEINKLNPNKVPIPVPDTKEKTTDSKGEAEKTIGTGAHGSTGGSPLQKDTTENHSSSPKSSKENTSSDGAPSKETGVTTGKQDSSPKENPSMPDAISTPGTVSVDSTNLTELILASLSGDSTVRECVSRVLLLLFALCGAVVLF